MIKVDRILTVVEVIVKVVSFAFVVDEDQRPRSWGSLDKVVKSLPLASEISVDNLKRKIEWKEALASKAISKEFNLVEYVKKRIISELTRWITLGLTDPILPTLTRTKLSARKSRASLRTAYGKKRGVSVSFLY